MRKEELKKILLNILIKEIENYLNYNTFIPCYLFYSDKILIIDPIGDEKIKSIDIKIKDDDLINIFIDLIENKLLLKNLENYDNLKNLIKDNINK